jgi:hypothetical protein
MLKKILLNEVSYSLGRQPDPDELKNFVDYVNDYITEQDRLGKKVFLVNIESVIKEYRDANYRQCEECGECYEIGSNEWNDDGYHCVKCKPNYDPDMMPGGHDYY